MSIKFTSKHTENNTVYIHIYLGFVGRRGVIDADPYKHNTTLAPSWPHNTPIQMEDDARGTFDPMDEDESADESAEESADESANEPGPKPVVPRPKRNQHRLVKRQVAGMCGLCRDREKYIVCGAALAVIIKTNALEDYDSIIDRTGYVRWAGSSSFQISKAGTTLCTVVGCGCIQYDPKRVWRVSRKHNPLRRKREPLLRVMAAVFRPGEAGLPKFGGARTNPDDIYFSGTPAHREHKKRKRADARIPRRGKKRRVAGTACQNCRKRKDTMTKDEMTEMLARLRVRDPDAMAAGSPEVWRPVTGKPGYSMNDIGFLRCNDCDLRTRSNRLYFLIPDQQKIQEKTAVQVVAETFLEKPPIDKASGQEMFPRCSQGRILTADTIRHYPINRRIVYRRGTMVKRDNVIGSAVQEFDSISHAADERGVSRQAIRKFLDGEVGEAAEWTIMRPPVAVN